MVWKRISLLIVTVIAAIAAISCGSAPATLPATANETESDLGEGVRLGVPASVASHTGSMDPGFFENIVSLTELTPIENGYHLGWHVRFRGDYDLNGTVNIADLTLLAKYWGAEVGDDPHMQYVDCVPFGEIGAPEIAPIAWSFGVTFSCTAIMLSDSSEGPWRVVRMEPSRNAIGWENAWLYYEADIVTRPTDRYIWMWAILTPDPEWHWIDTIVSLQ